MKWVRDILKHSILMVKRNFKSYALLSITVVLSFSFLLVFFLFSDSNIYNDYKETFRLEDDLLFIDYDSDDKAKIFFQVLDRTESIEYYQYFQKSEYLTHYSTSELQVLGDIFFLPMGTQDFYGRNEGNYEEIKLIDGRLNLLDKDEAVITNRFYNLLGLNEKENPLVSIPLINKEGKSILKDFKVVGFIEDYNIEQDISNYRSMIILPRDIVYDYDIKIDSKHIFVKSPNPLYVSNLAYDFNFNLLSSHTMHREANEEIHSQVLLKGLTLGIIFVLLSINLYSSFSNALSDRRFEIGVKRAIGAGKKHILWQFFFEGMLVMLLDIIVSISLTFIIALIYKAYQMISFDYQWTIYIGKYSILLFTFTSLFLSLLFSLTFALRSTEVEIVSQLKLE